MPHHINRADKSAWWVTPVHVSMGIFLYLLVGHTRPWQHCRLFLSFLAIIAFLIGVFGCLRVLGTLYLLFLVPGKWVFSGKRVFLAVRVVFRFNFLTKGSCGARNWLSTKWGDFSSNRIFCSRCRYVELRER